MSRRSTFLAAALLLLTFIACKKSNNGGGATPAALAGNWSFVSLAARVTSTATETGGGVTDKDITVSQYTTTNNTGVITFLADSMFAKGLGYSVNTQAEAYQFENGILLDSASAPFSFTLPPTNSATKYQLIGTDSIYYPAGGLLNMQGSGGPTPVGASGGRYVISGGTMTITIGLNQSSTQSAGGITLTSVQQGTEVVTLKKQ